jgi:hypothetical protein
MTAIANGPHLAIVLKCKKHRRPRAGMEVTPLGFGRRYTHEDYVQCPHCVVRDTPDGEPSAITHDPTDQPGPV